MTISELLTPREEVTEGRFQGVLQAHKAEGDSDRLENSANRLLSMTYPSNALLNIFDRVDDKLTGRDSQGGILLTGPYGSGKSHGLLSLYHLFNSPKVGQEFTDDWGIELSLPDNADATILSTSETDADLIWEPVFRKLGREDVLEEIDRYPTTDHIEEVAGDDTVAILFDEIETWWGSFDEENDDTLIERNEFFLQNLLEVANDPDHNLFVFITLLDKNQDIKRILDRTNPHGEDLNSTGDRERIILHRLFETRRDELDDEKVRSIVEEYVENYNEPIEIDEPKRYENRMVETYPFHPELLDLLDSIYEAARERQNVRGAMNVLAETVREKYEETDLIITSDVKPRAFRGINRTLFDRYVSDLETVEDIDFGEELLRTILLYTLDEREQMASVTQTLLGTYKPSKTTADKLHISLQNLYGTAHYLDRDAEKDHYYITEDPKLTALVTREQERALDDNQDAIEETLVEVVRDEVWDNEVYVYPEDEIPDDDSIHAAVTLDYLSNGALEEQLKDFFEGRKYQNTVLFVTPKKEIREDNEIVKKAARVLGAENLRGKVDDEKGELQALIRDERRELRNELEDRYGKWVKWVEDSKTGDLRMRRINVSASVSAVKDNVGSDKRYIGEKILDEVEDTAGGITVNSMLNDFKQFRKMPVVLDDEVFYGAVRKLHRDEKVVLEGDRAKYYVAEHGDYPSEISDELTIHHPENLPSSVFEEEDEEEETDDGTTTLSESVSGGTSTGTTSTTTTTGTGATGTTTEPDEDEETVQTTTEVVKLEGNRSRVLRSMAESRVNAESDTATKVELSYDVDDLSKDDLIEFLEELPDGNEITAEVVITREIDD